MARIGQSAGPRNKIGVVHFCSGRAAGVLAAILSLHATFAAAQVIARVSERPDGSELAFGQAFAPIISADGRRVVFTRSEGLWLKDLPTGALTQILASSFSSGASSISADGRLVLFASSDTGLVPGKSNLCFEATTFGQPRRVPCIDLFLLDVESGAVSRVLGPEGVEVSANSSGVLSADGRWIAMAREFRNDPVLNGPRQVLLQDRMSGATTVVASGFDRGVSISDDGRRLAFIGTTVTGTTSANNVLVFDRVSGTTERADVDVPAGVTVSFDARISGDGLVVAFDGSSAGCAIGPMSRIFMRDLEWKRTSEVLRDAQPCADVDLSGLSRDGRFVLFESSTPNLVADDPSFGDVFVVERMTGAIARASRGAAQPDGVSFGATMSADGGRVVFTSQALNLLPARAVWANHVYLASLDLDADGMADAWERYFGLSASDRADAAQDPDRDGASNVEEFRAGTHPRGPFRLRTTGAVVNPDTSRVLLRNASSQATVLWLRAVDAQGRSFARPFTLGPQQTTILSVTDLANRPASSFTMQIDSDQPVRAGLSR